MKKLREPGPWMNDYHPTENPKQAMRWFGKSMTRQSEAEACDINKIMEKYAETGMLPEYIKENPSYGDFSSTADFMEAMNITSFAKSQFAALSAKVRAFFENDPQKMLQYVEDATKDPEKNRELVRLGLATPPQPPKKDPTLEALKDINSTLKASAASKAKKGAGGTPPVNDSSEGS